MISLKKKISKVSALALAGSIMISQPVFAETIETASTPASSAESSNVVIANSGENYISQSGPTGEKQYNENGILVYNAGTSSDSSGTVTIIGPSEAENYIQETSAETDDTSETQTETESTETAALIDIDESIEKPEISAEAAILYDTATGQVLFEQNADEQLYPASTTKLMTALLAVSNLDLESEITFSSSAVSNLESGAITAGMQAGDTMTVMDALNALLIRSACEVANAVGEAVSGSQEAFAALMNEKAAELGCTGTHFANASGLNDTEHYTTARDMALIAAEALSNDTIREITLTKSYTLPKTSSRDELTITNTCAFVKGTDELEGYIGGKTGYTSKAGSCLVSMLEVGDRRLISVVLKATSPQQYSDTKALYEYAEKLLGVSESIDSDASDTESTDLDQTKTEDGWEQLSTGEYKYKKADGTYCTNEWLDLGSNSYFFDADSIMCTGWKKFSNGSWYYFNPETGAMVTDKWVVQDGKSYYLQSDGTMAVDTIINGMYQVDENGVYVKKVG